MKRASGGGSEREREREKGRESQADSLLTAWNVMQGGLEPLNCKILI